MSITSANRLELLQIADAVAREKMIDPDLVLQAMEESYAKAAKSKYGSELDIRAKIDRKSGELEMTARARSCGRSGKPLYRDDSGRSWRASGQRRSWRLGD